MTLREIEFRERIARAYRIQRIQKIQEIQKEDKIESENTNYDNIMPSIDGIRKSIVNFQKNTKEVIEDER